MSTDEPDGDDGLTPAQRAEVKKLVANETEETETTRRDALKMGGGLLGLGGILTAGSGTAAAGDDQVGSLGTDNNRMDAELEDLDLTDQSSTPAGPGSGQVRLYARNGTLYYKPAGGSETQVGGGGGTGIFEDTNSDGIYEQTTGNGIETPSVSTEHLQSDNSVQPNWNPKRGGQDAPTSLRWSPDNGSPEFEEFVDVSSIIGDHTEGLAVHDGDLYLGDAVSSGGASIYQLDGSDGSLIDQMNLTASEGTHLNTLAWINGKLWATDALSYTDQTHIIDWDSKTIEKTISHDLGDTIPIAYLPDVDGNWYIINHTVDSPDTYLLDASVAENQQSMAAAEVKQLSNGWENQKQGGVWTNGHMIWATHHGIWKTRIPFADEMADGYPVGNGASVSWYQPQFNHSSTIDYNWWEQPGYDPQTNRIFLPGENKIYVGREGHANGVTPHLPSHASIVNSGFKAGQSLETAPATDPVIIRQSGQNFSGRLTVWMYDDGTSPLDQIINLVLEGTTNTSLGVKTDNTAANYVYYDGTYRDSGIPRPSNPRWVGFSFLLDGNQHSTYVSTNGGMTWENAHTAAGGRVDYIRFYTRDGTARWSNLTLDPFVDRSG